MTSGSDSSIRVCKCQNVENYAVLHQQRLWLSHWKSFLPQGCPEGKKSVPYPHRTAGKTEVCVIAPAPCFGASTPLLCWGAEEWLKKAPLGLPPRNHVLLEACELD